MYVAVCMYIILRSQSCCVFYGIVRCVSIGYRVHTDEPGVNGTVQ